MKTIDTICIIDDDNIYSFMLQKTLLKLNICKQIVAFGNGEEAIQSLQKSIKTHQTIPDIIFLDINMPIMNGWEFLEAFSKIKPSLQKEVTIYQTSSSVGLDMQLANPAANDYIKAYLGKTIDRATLLHIADNYVKN